MKHFKKLFQLFALTAFEYTLYSAAIIYQFTPALKLLPFYLCVQIALGCVLITIIILGKAFAVRKVPDDAGYYDYQKTYGWLTNTKTLISIFWSFAFASQGMYWAAVGLLLEEGISCVLRTSLLSLYEENDRLPKAHP